MTALPDAVAASLPVSGLPLSDCLYPTANR